MGKNHVTVYPEMAGISLVRRKKNEALSKTRGIITDPEVSHLPLNFDLLTAQLLTVFWDCKLCFIIVPTSDICLTEMFITTLNCSNLHSNWSMKFQSNSPGILFSVNYFPYFIVFCISRNGLQIFPQLMKMKKLCGKAETFLIIVCLA